LAALVLGIFAAGYKWNKTLTKLGTN